MDCRGENSTSFSFNQFQKNLLRFVGLYPPSNDVNIILRIVYKIYSVFLILISSTLVFSQYVYLCSKDNILESVLGGTSETVGFTMVLLKTVTFMYTVKENVRIQTMVENSWKTVYVQRNSETHDSLVTDTERSINRITYASCYIMLVTNVFFVGAPILTDHVNGSEILTEMPMRIWLPFELNSWSRRITMYVTEWLIISYFCCAMLGLINLYACILSLLSAQFKILKNEFTKFADDYKNTLVAEKQCNNSVYFRLKRNVERHEKLLRMCKEVNVVLSPIFVLMIAGEIFIMCFSGYEISLSEGLCKAVYFSKWWKLPRKHRTLLLIVMQRSSRPVVFRASKFCTMSLKNYVKFLKTSYSYFTLLRTLHSTTILPGRK